MGTRRWLTKEGLAREHRERVRAFMEKVYRRKVDDEELDRAFVDFEKHYYLMQDRLGDINDGSDAGDEDTDISVH